jgi:PAS domain S-box-containing protein
MVYEDGCTMTKTSDKKKTKAQLVEELQRLRKQVAELQKLADGHALSDSELAQDQRLLHALLDHVPDHIYFKDAKSRFIKINRSTAAWLSLDDPAEAVGKTDFDIFTQEHAQATYEDEQEVMQSGQPIFKEEKETWPDGRETWVSTVKMPLHDDEGRTVGTFGISRDITAIKEVEAERERLLADVRQSERLLRSIIDATPDWIFIKDKEHRYALVNQGYADALHLTPDDFVGKNDLDLGFPEEQVKGNPEQGIQGFWADDRQVMDSGEPLVILCDLATVDGKLHVFNTIKTPLRNAKGEIWGVLGMARDVTERERLLTDLERRSAQLQTAAEVSHAASGTLDLNKLIQQVVGLARERFDLYYAGLFLVDETSKWAVLRAGTGEAGEKMLAQGHKLGIGGTSMVGWCVANKQARIALDVGEEAVRFDNPLLPATRSELALPLVSRDQAIGALTIQSTHEAAFSEEDISVLQTMADQLANAIANARLYDQAQREIAERKRAEEALARQAQALDAELEEFFFVASHHLQEPLRTVTSFSQLLARRYGNQLGPEADEYIAYMAGGAARIRDLVNDVLAYSRVTTRAKPFQPTDCATLLDSVLAGLQDVIERNSAVVTYNALPTVMADTAQLRRVFQILIGNAIKFRSDSPPEIHIEADHRNDAWLFSVEDNGIGIESQYCERIFELFQRLHTEDKYPGTGIGLAICKKIVERHGGRTWVESKPGEGSTFYFTIPDRGDSS